MTSSPHYYFGIAPHLLNPILLDYQWFGVIWLEENNQPIILGYWFSNVKSEITQQAIEAGFSKWTEISDLPNTLTMYQSIRNKQKKQDWENRTRLSIQTIFKSPWKEASSGLYILKSRDKYPLHVSAVHKKKLFIWLEHSAVCETEEELHAFIKQVNEEHQVELEHKKSSPTVK